MTRRRFIGGVAGVVLLTIITVVALVALAGNSVDEQVARIQPGMTTEQVQEIMGRTADRIIFYQMAGEASFDSTSQWDVGRYRVHANFGQQSLVSVDVTVEETRLQRLWRWLGW